jgi:isoleucyl-tRNA synthetase
VDGIELDCDAEGCDGTMRRIPAVIDTWFDSGAMPWAQFHYPFENEEVFEQRFPADFICEAIDQTRGWFYTLLAESVLLFDTSSYRNVVCLGLILDPEGQKMSKSRGNVVEPDDVIERHGADAFRWYYFTSQQPWAGYRFSVDAVGEAVRQFLLTLWNTYSFWVLYAGSEGLGPGDFAQSPVPGPQSSELDRWALSRLQRTTALVRERMDDFDCTTAGRAIADYVEELSNWYVRLNRRRFWEGDRDAFATLRHCLVEAAKLLAPFTPFLADEIYANLTAGEAGEFGEAPDSVHLCDFPQPARELIDDELEAGMEAVQRTVELGRAARAQAKAKIRQPLRKAVVVASEAERAAIERLTTVVSSELNVKEIEFVTEEAELVSYRVRPNYRTLGPRFGKSMPQVAAAVEALDAAHVADALEEGAKVGISIDGADHELTADDIDLVMEPLEGYQVEAEAGHAVALALELDDELRAEGLAREVVRAVQNARKEAGLEISDRISLELGGDPELLDAARAHEEYVTGETLATSVSYGGDGAGEPTTIEGRELRIALERA